MDERLYVNGSLIELPKRSVARSLQINDFREVKDRQANYSNNIKIPKTSNNIEVFDNLGMVGATTNIQYQQVAIKYVLNGIQLIDSGKGIVKNTDEFYNLVIYDGNISLTGLLGTDTLSDLDFNTAPYNFNHQLSVSLFLNSFNNTSGYVYALPKQTGVTTIEETIPSFYIHTLFEMIFAQKGWSISGDIFSNTEYLSRIQTVEQGFDKTLLGSKTNVQGYPINIDLSRNGGVNTEFTVTTFNVLSEGIYDISLDGLINVNFGAVTLRIKKNGSTVKDYPILPNDGFPFIFNFSLFATNGDTITVTEYASIDNLGSYDYDANYTINIQNDARYFAVNFNNIIGNTKQIDFVKDVMQRFNLSFRKKKHLNELEFITSEALLTGLDIAEDWSYLFSRKLNESYKSSYGQANKAVYKYDENSEDYADGVLLVNDVNLTLEKTLFTSIYKASRKVGSVYVTSYWNEDEPNQDGLRIFKKTMSGVLPLTFRFLSTDNTSSINVNYALWDFTGLDYQTELDTYYPTFKEFLNDFKIITIEANIDSIDIYNLDFFRLKYIKQLGRYFYVNKVVNFIEGKPTKIELIQIPI